MIEWYANSAVKGTHKIGYNNRAATVTATVTSFEMYLITITVTLKI